METSRHACALQSNTACSIKVQTNASLQVLHAHCDITSRILVQEATDLCNRQQVCQVCHVHAMHAEACLASGLREGILGATDGCLETAGMTEGRLLGLAAALPACVCCIPAAQARLPACWLSIAPRACTPPEQDCQMDPLVSHTSCTNMLRWSSSTLPGCRPGHGEPAHVSCNVTKITMS